LYYGIRYDERANLYDWDYQMKWKERGVGRSSTEMVKILEDHDSCSDSQDNELVSSPYSPLLSPDEQILLEQCDEKKAPLPTEMWGHPVLYNEFREKGISFQAHHLQIESLKGFSTSSSPKDKKESDSDDVRPLIKPQPALAADITAPTCENHTLKYLQGDMRPGSRKVDLFLGELLVGPFLSFGFAPFPSLSPALLRKLYKKKVVDGPTPRLLCTWYDIGVANLSDVLRKMHNLLKISESSSASTGTSTGHVDESVYCSDGSVHKKHKGIGFSFVPYSGRIIDMLKVSGFKDKFDVIVTPATTPDCISKEFIMSCTKRDASFVSETGRFLFELSNELLQRFTKLNIEKMEENGCYLDKKAKENLLKCTIPPSHIIYHRAVKP
ncbi:Dynein assembly factor 3, axonemal like protein, partial [Aduncisulcus paluster]